MSLLSPRPGALSPISPPLLPLAGQQGLGPPRDVSTDTAGLGPTLVPRTLDPLGPSISPPGSGSPSAPRAWNVPRLQSLGERPIQPHLLSASISQTGEPSPREGRGGGGAPQPRSCPWACVTLPPLQGPQQRGSRARARLLATHCPAQPAGQEAGLQPYLPLEGPASRRANIRDLRSFSCSPASYPRVREPLSTCPPPHTQREPRAR